ncbi:ketopantoate reductase family protein [Acidilobus sp.]|uniref:ketopantoate reductase family protein n=1 Tax=Acidilobus sp. TaxID=1872109 RepID=UPI003D048D17
MLRVAIVGGCGAAGSVAAAALVKGGVSVEIIDRGKKSCSGEEVEVEGLWKGRLKVCGWDSAKGPYDVVILFTKAYDAGGAIEDAVKLNAKLYVSPHNGLGPLELLEERAGSRAAGAIVYYGATRVSRCRSRYNGGGKVILGCRRGCDEALLRDLSEALKTGGLDAIVTNPEDFQSERWLKLAVNSAINPVTALSWDKNEVIIKDDSARDLAAYLAAETGNVASQLGIKLPEDPVEATYRTARETADNCSSTVQDLAANRETELKYINLAVWNASVSLQVRAVANLSVYRAVEVASRWLKGRRSPCVRS